MTNHLTRVAYGLIYSLKGLRHAYCFDKSFKIEVWGGFLWIAFAYALWPLEKTEILFLALSFALILITELVNTAFERALERLHPERHELIGATKDIASAAVFVAICFAIVTALVILVSRF